MLHQGVVGGTKNRHKRQGVVQIILRQREREIANQSYQCLQNRVAGPGAGDRLGAQQKCWPTHDDHKRHRTERLAMTRRPANAGNENNYLRIKRPNAVFAVVADMHQTRL